MSRKTYILLLPVFIAVGTLYTWWTQPQFGPPSGQSIFVRTMLIGFWLVLLLIARGAHFDRFGWQKFFIGFACGGAWLIGLVSLADTVSKAAMTVLLVLIVSGICGFYASLTKSNLRAGVTGMLILYGQIALVAFFLGIGLIKFHFGM